MCSDGQRENQWMFYLPRPLPCFWQDRRQQNPSYDWDLTSQVQQLFHFWSFLTVSVKMSTLLWISSPREIQDTLPFLTWILSYGHINGNSWPPQGAVSSAVSRAEKMRSVVMTHAAGLAPWTANGGRPSLWGDTMCTASVWDWGAALWSWDNSSEWPSGNDPAWAHIYDYICFTFQANHLVSLSCFHSQTLLRATGYKTQE